MGERFRTSRDIEDRYREKEKVECIRIFQESGIEAATPSKCRNAAGEDLARVLRASPCKLGIGVNPPRENGNSVEMLCCLSRGWDGRTGGRNGRENLLGSAAPRTSTLRLFELCMDTACLQRVLFASVTTQHPRVDVILPGYVCDTSIRTYDGNNLEALARVAVNVAREAWHSLDSKRHTPVTVAVALANVRAKVEGS
ncbi:hypothetical protein HZH68_013331 [Vespula germanica]|uniref:Uncharacterized protein n=1 Tax=Vespula germanica TaxID=30212 RepID=A0A834JD69_VESGE|nr:hypothetical protein HZH68_013331 [Vespula germanica]